MTGLHIQPALAAALLLAAFAANDADAATIRRHVHCFAYATGIVIPIVNQTLPGAVQITNNWSFTIPAGTVYTYSYGGHQKSYQSPNALGPNAVLSVGDPAVTTTEGCDATYPDPNFGLNSGALKNKLVTSPGLTLQTAP